MISQKKLEQRQINKKIKHFSIYIVDDVFQNNIYWDWYQKYFGFFLTFIFDKGFYGIK